MLDAPRFSRGAGQRALTWSSLSAAPSTLENAGNGWIKSDSSRSGMRCFTARLSSPSISPARGWTMVASVVASQEPHGDDLAVVEGEVRKAADAGHVASREDPAGRLQRARVDLEPAPLGGGEAGGGQIHAAQTRLPPSGHQELFRGH